MAEVEVNSTMSEQQVVAAVKEVPDVAEDEATVVTKNVVVVVDAKVENVEKPKTISSILHDKKVELCDNEVKALVEFKKLVQAALESHEFSSTTSIAPPPAPPSVEEETEREREREQEKVELVDEDGTKTVEPIEETVVQQQQQTSVAVVDGSSPPAAEEQQEVKTRTKEEALLSEKGNASSLVPPPEEVSIWGVPLMKDERTDTILWKFLQARDFKVKGAFTMLKNTLKWRKEFGIDNLLDENLGGDLANKVAFMHGVCKEGNPVCYNVYGAFQDKELYLQTFSDEVKTQKFLKWRVQFLEKSVRKLDFNPSGINTIVQVNDLKNSPGPSKWELRQATKQALQLFQDNYPEFVAKQVLINVPWWYMAVNKMISPFLTQRTKSKFVVAGPSKSADILLNYIAPEQVPIQYGGLSKTGELSVKDGVTQIIVKPISKETVEFAVTEACHLTWEVRVLGWEVSYGAEFVPNAKDGYTVIIQKLKKIGANEENIIRNSFKTSEPGKVVLTIDNSSSQKKRLLYRLEPMTSSH